MFTFIIFLALFLIGNKAQTTQPFCYQRNRWSNTDCTGSIIEQTEIFECGICYNYPDYTNEWMSIDCDSNQLYRYYDDTCSNPDTSNVYTLGVCYGFGIGWIIVDCPLTPSPTPQAPSPTPTCQKTCANGLTSCSLDSDCDGICKYNALFARQCFGGDNNGASCSEIDSTAGCTGSCTCKIPSPTPQAPSPTPYVPESNCYVLFKHVPDCSADGFYSTEIFECGKCESTATSSFYKSCDSDVVDMFWSVTDCSVYDYSWDIGYCFEAESLEWIYVDCPSSSPTPTPQAPSPTPTPTCQKTCSDKLTFCSDDTDCNGECLFDESGSNGAGFYCLGGINNGEVCEFVNSLPVGCEFGPCDCYETTPSPTPTPSPTYHQSSCVHSYGYWKTHPEERPLDGEICGLSYEEILWTEPKEGNGFFILTHQWIALLENIAQYGIALPTALEECYQTIVPDLLDNVCESSDSTDGYFPKRSEQRAQALACAELFAAFNENEYSNQCSYDGGEVSTLNRLSGITALIDKEGIRINPVVHEGSSLQLFNILFVAQLIY